MSPILQHGINFKPGPGVSIAVVANNPLNATDVTISAAGAGFVFTQGSPTAVWNITHSLGAFPSVTVVDSGGSEIWPTVLYVDANNVTLTFGSATSGKAYLN